VIKSFADKETKKLFEGGKSKAVPPDVRESAPNRSLPFSTQRKLSKT
jgi:hypothetical protein